jgi:DHA2 family multidrug resistance protein
MQRGATGVHPLMMVSIMLSATVYSLDSTIAAVALPQMQGAFSTTQDQAAWILTSYIVSSAIMTPMAGYLVDRVGRRRVYLFAVAGFVIASVACGLAVNLEEMILFRVLQGAFGAPLIPLAQASILDAYTPETYGRGMAIFGVGVMLGPIIGPTLGGWLTEYFSWRWVFMINLPIGALALAGLYVSVRDHPGEDRERPFDLAGFAYLGIAIGALQLMLDRGNSLSWFQSTEIQLEALTAVVCMYLFVMQILTKQRAFVDPHIFRDRNFSLSLVLAFVIGLNLMATMAILPPFTQTLLGYPVLTAGEIMAPRGLGTMISMGLAGRLIGRFDTRWVITFGLVCVAVALWQMTLFDHNVTPWKLAQTGFLQGFGLGFTFVPLSSMAFATLPARYRADASAFYALGRNIGSAIGVSVLMGALAVFVRQNRAQLVTNLDAFNPLVTDPAMALPWVTGRLQGMQILDNIVQREALMMGYLQDFRLMTLMTCLAIPLVIIMRPQRPAAAA